MASQEELRLALRQALKARTFDPKLCLARAQALRSSDIDPIADVDLARWMAQLRQLDPQATAGQRARLAGALDRIGLRRTIAIRKRGARWEAMSPAG